MNVDKWIEALQHPLVLAGFGLFLFAALIKPLFLNNEKLSGTAMERLLHKGMNFAFALALLAIAGGLLLSWKPIGNTSDDKKQTVKPAEGAAQLLHPEQVSGIKVTGGNVNIVIHQYIQDNEEKASRKIQENKKYINETKVYQTEDVKVVNAAASVISAIKNEAARKVSSKDEDEKQETDAKDIYSVEEGSLHAVKDAGGVSELRPDLEKTENIYIRDKETSIQQKEESPDIEDSGNVSVDYGLSKDKFEAILKQQYESIVKEIQGAGAAADEQKRFLLEQKEKDVQEKLTDIEKSYEEELKRRKAADEALAKMQAQLPAALIEKAQISLRDGDTQAAEHVFQSVIDEEGGAVALAAYQLGKLAEIDLDYIKALRNYKKMIALEENNPDYLFAAGNMARTMADYAQAEKWFKHLIRIREAEKNSIGLAIVLDSLASVHQDQGHYIEAELYFQQALSIQEKTLGKDHPGVAQSLNNLTVLYCIQGRYAEAEPLCRRALTIREKTLGKDHPDVAQSLNNLAALYYMQGRYAEAEPLLLHSLVVREKIFGKDHPYFAESLSNLAGLYNLQGKYAESELLYKRALAIREKMLGKDHPDVAIIMKNIAWLYETQGKYSEAELLYQRCLAILRAKFSNGHPNIDSMQKSYDAMKRKMAEQGK